MLQNIPTLTLLNLSQLTLKIDAIAPFRHFKNFTPLLFKKLTTTEKMEFAIDINAPKEKVWNTLWEDATYQEWTAPFAAGSKAITDWQQGSKVLFVDDKNSGMVSTIVENKPTEYMSIKHLGIVKNGVEDMDSPESREWSGGLENYTLKNVDGKTHLEVEMSAGAIPEQMLEYFNNTWPRALDKLKEIA